jgi:hypothetical protein
MSNCYVNRFVDSFKGYFASNNPKSQQISGHKTPYVNHFVGDFCLTPYFFSIFLQNTLDFLKVCVYNKSQCAKL